MKRKLLSVLYQQIKYVYFLKSLIFRLFFWYSISDLYYPLLYSVCHKNFNEVLKFIKYNFKYRL